MQNHMETKKEILRFLQMNGPSLPVHIAKSIRQSILFSSAFLSELLYEKELKMSFMRVGSSPIYFLSGQEQSLEKYSQHLKSKEKDAFALLKEKKFLKDSEQEPAIRVALRAIRDFAIPFKKNEEIFWRYFTTAESEFEIPEVEIQKVKINIPKEISSIPVSPEQISKSKKEIQTEDVVEEKSKSSSETELQKSSETSDISEEKPIEILKETREEKIEIQKQVKKKKLKKSTKKKSEKKKDDKFFNKIKEYLSKNSIELLDIENFRKDEIILKIKDKKEKILFAYNKKKITEKEIIKAHKKASELNLSYIVVSLGEIPKKLKELIEALKDLNKIEKLE